MEGVRTDVRVCNLELLGMAWYGDQMGRKAYESDRMPFSLTHDEYREGTRDYLYIAPTANTNYKSNTFYDLKGIIDFIKSPDPANMIELGDQKEHNYFPTANFSLKVDKAQILKNGDVPASMADSIVSELHWKVPGNLLERNKILVLDAIAHNDWKRPICFATTLPADAYLGLDKYLQTEGLVYQLVPVLNTSTNSIEGRRIASDKMYDNVMHKFKWGNMGSGVYLDDNIRRMAADLRIETGLLAEQLIHENKKDSAIKVMDLVNDSIPQKSSPYDYFETFIIQGYYEAHDFDKANKLSKIMFDNSESWVEYLKTLAPENRNYYGSLMRENLDIMKNLYFLANNNQQKDLLKIYETRLDRIQKEGLLE